MGPYVLVCRDDFPAQHAYLVAQALNDHRAALAATASAEPTDAPDNTAAVPAHPGVLAYLDGQPVPEITSPEP